MAKLEFCGWGLGFMELGDARPQRGPGAEPLQRSRTKPEAKFKLQIIYMKRIKAVFVYVQCTSMHLYFLFV